MSPRPAPETPQVVLAAHFEECGRLLRAHPELFDEEALAKVGVVAGLSTRITRRAASRSKVTWDALVGEVLPLLFASVAQGTRGPDPEKERALARTLTAGAWRAYRRWIAARATRLFVQYSVDANAVDGPTLTSPCPRCGLTVTRSLEAPAPCSACSFVFETEEPGGEGR